MLDKKCFGSGKEEEACWDVAAVGGRGVEAGEGEDGEEEDQDEAEDEEGDEEEDALDVCVLVCYVCVGVRLSLGVGVPPRNCVRCVRSVNVLPGLM